MKLFYQVLVNSFLSSLTVMMVWFALSLWVCTKTQSVLATSVMSGVYLVAAAITGVWFGSLVDRHQKKTMMIISSVVSLVAFIIAFALYQVLPDETFTNHASIGLWLLVLTTFVGVVVGNIRSIVMPTLVTIMVKDNGRDKANGLVGTSNGITFLISSIVSGFLLASSGLFWIMIASILILVLSLVHLLMIEIPEKDRKPVSRVETKGKPAEKEGMWGTIKVITHIPGLLALILFTSFNNFLGGVFMPLLDPYGLSLVPLQVWGTLWGFLSLGFIIGGLFIAKRGLGKNPLRTLFLINICLWVIGILFAIQPWIVLLSIGIFCYICLVPFVEASEHTIIQKIVPRDRQGRVFGLAQSVESAASPLTTFAVGPLAQFVFIPFMTTGAGVKLIGNWFGVGPGRGIALVFITASCLGLLVTLLAMRSKAYLLLAKQYAD